ncbi:MAG: SDR family NAD(P)-dependent oxidoreductase [Solirubrobacteraceae bacterium]
MGRIELAGATTLLTGATGGIGRAIAAAMTARDVRLLLSGRRREELATLAAQLPAAGTITADLALADDVARLCDEAVAAGTQILIANAALPATGELVDLDQAEIDRMLDVNLRAPIALARALAPSMVARGGGQMVFIASLAGKAASPASSIYSATKFGLRGFALGLRADLRAHGVGVSLVTPGFISDAGIFARAGVRLPRGVATRPPSAVTEAVIRAIERDRAELAVAPASLRLGAAIASVAPELAARGARLLGSDRIASQFAERQRHERS